MSFCMDFTSFLGAFWHNFSCFWVIDFLMISLIVFFRIFDTKMAPKQNGGPPLFVTFSILFRRRCLWRFLASRWLPFGSIFGTPALQLGMPALHLATPALHLATPAVQLGTPALHLATPALQLGTPALHLATPALHLATPALHFGSIWQPFGILVDLCWFMLIYGARTDYSLGRDQSNWLFPRQGLKVAWSMKSCWFMLIYGAKTDYSLGGVQDRWNIDLCWFMLIYVDLWCQNWLFPRQGAFCVSNIMKGKVR